MFVFFFSPKCLVENHVHVFTMHYIGHSENITMMLTIKEQKFALFILYTNHVKHKCLKTEQTCKIHGIMI